jgi:cell division protein FtsI (penicillin-binding protein 3)
LKLQLTIDLPHQRAARFALIQALEQYNAKRGAVIVMDARDGSILSLVCVPSYDPNKYYEANLELFKNWTVMDLYEPGSTFKPINVAIALDAGVIKPDSVFYDPGQIVIDRWPISNHDFLTKGGHGNINVADILQVSSNVGMIKIMQRLNPTIYYRNLKKLGLGEKIGLDLPGDAPSHLKEEAKFISSAIEPATAAFGQGLSLTPLKLVQLHAALANGGKLVTPHIVQGLVDPEGHFHWQPTLKTTPVFTPKTAKTVLEMMETVVTDGSGKNAAISGYRIAGKTGTAQKASPNGGYLRNAKITSFIATLPVDAPRYVVLAVIDEPKGENTFGSTVAAPVVKSVMDALIAIEKLPPSQPVELVKPSTKQEIIHE